MNKARERRKRLAKLRKPFPKSAPDPASLDLAELTRWDTECQQQAAIASAWTLDGFRWRRARNRLNRVYFARLVAHVGPTPGLCDHCGTRAVDVHVASGQNQAPEFAHYCNVCHPNMPVGWMVVSAIQRKRA